MKMSETKYIPDIMSGESPASRPMITPSGMPPPIGIRNSRNAPQAPDGHMAGRGAVGSIRGARKSDGIGSDRNDKRSSQGWPDFPGSGRDERWVRWAMGA